MDTRISDLLKPPTGLNVDFSRPRGAPALTPAHGISWEVFANPVSLFIGGVAAVLLELAEPRVRSGVWDHSSFQRDPLMRLRRTGFAAMITVYAPHDQAEAMIANVVRMHERVVGTTPAEHPYRANDEELLNWVQVTASFGFCEAYHQYVRPLTLEEKSRLFAEGQHPARLYGALGAPSSWQSWETLLQRTAPNLEDSAILAEFLEIIERMPLLPRPLRGIQSLLVAAAVEITPAPVRHFAPLQRRKLGRSGLAIVRAAGALCKAMPLPQLPARQAQRRVPKT